MRNMRVAAVVVGVLLSLPAMGQAVRCASDPESQAPATNYPAAAQQAMHATKGVVKSVDVTTLVITRSPRNGREMTFVLNPSTERDGNVTVGSTVEVRYRSEARRQVATVISVQGHKQSS